MSSESYIKLGDLVVLWSEEEEEGCLSSGG
jgi:hypothetical protein